MKPGAPGRNQSFQTLGADCAEVTSSASSSTTIRCGAAQSFMGHLVDGWWGASCPAWSAIKR